jgi:hypothetical protein
MNSGPACHGKHIISSGNNAGSAEAGAIGAAIKNKKFKPTGMHSWRRPWLRAGPARYICCFSAVLSKISIEFYYDERRIRDGGHFIDCLIIDCQ